MSMSENTGAIADVTELLIPMPWGYVAAKTWGDQTKPPVLCLHGDLDNAASFDKLIPLLPVKLFSFVCIDLPGHGFSSHFGRGLPYTSYFYISVIKRIVEHFKWVKVNIMGHHSGGLLALFFACSYSILVDKLILIDIISKSPTGDTISRILIARNHSKADVFGSEEINYETCCQKLQSCRPYPMSAEGLNILMERNVRKLADGKYFKIIIDPQILYVEYPLISKKQLRNILYQVKCHLLVLITKDIARCSEAFPIKSHNTQRTVNHGFKFEIRVLAKTWGNPQNWPILCVHGIQDNANTFNHLIPLLPSSFYYVCIDLPGHGHSSHFPPGIVLDFFDYVVVIKRVLDHFEWKKVHYMAHSLGAQLGAYFSALFPQHVLKLVMLDAVAPFAVPIQQHWSRQRILITNLLKLEKQINEGSVPQYSYEEALGRLMINRFSSLSRQSAEALLERCVVENTEGFSYSTDQRLKLTVIPNVDPKMNVEILSGIKCPQLLILAEETVPLIKMTFAKEVLNIYSRRSNCTCRIVKGNHNVHLDYPERVAPYVRKFLSVGKCSL